MKQILLATAATALLCLACVASAVVTECVSVNSSGVRGNMLSVAGNTSRDGRYVVLMSSADNLVDNDTNSVPDVFVVDRQTGVTERVSVATGDPGAQANGASCESIPDNSGFNEFAAMTPDGRYVVFSSRATNLVPDDTNGVPDVFVRDRGNHTTTRVSVSSAGSQANGTSYFSSISADGARVAFISIATNLVANDTNAAPDVFVRDIPSGQTFRVNLSSAPENAEATGQSVYSGHFIPDSDITAWISGDGKHVAIVSGATNMVSGDTNNTYDVFVRDIESGTTERVSVSTSGQQGNGFAWAHSNYISYNGSVVTFSSQATNMVPGDTNGVKDVFVRDRSAGTTTRVSAPAGGGQFSDESSDPSCSADGNTIGFGTWSADGSLANGYLVNKDGTGIQGIGVDSTGSPLPGLTVFPIPSSDGRYVTLLSFRSMADLSTGQAFLVDRTAITITDAKLEANDASVIVSGGFVTMECEDGFYFQQDGIASPEWVSGIRVVWPGAVSLGKRYTITGAMNTDPDNGERQVIATSVDPHTSGWTVTAKPLGLNNKSLGGGDFRCDPDTGAGQRGVTGGSGLNNIGILVRTTGACSYIDPHTFTVDDGSGVDVRCETPATILASTAWQQVAVTGISSIRKTGGDYERLFRVTSVEPVLSGPVEGITGRWEATITSGLGSGVQGMLLTQQGNMVSGIFREATLVDGQMSGALFTCSYTIDDHQFTFSLTHDGDVLSGTLTKDGTGYPFTIHRLSQDPVSPYIGRPQVVTATCDGTAIDVTWDRPVNGWDFNISCPGVSLDGDDWADRDGFSYDTGTNTFHLALLPTIPLVPDMEYTVSLDVGDGVDWHDPYGAPAWDDVSDCYTFTFSMPGPE